MHVWVHATSSKTSQDLDAVISSGIEHSKPPFSTGVCDLPLEYTVKQRDSFGRSEKHLIPTRLEDPACEGNPTIGCSCPEAIPTRNTESGKQSVPALKSAPCLDACRRLLASLPESPVGLVMAGRPFHPRRSTCMEGRETSTGGGSGAPAKP